LPLKLPELAVIVVVTTVWVVDEDVLPEDVLESIKVPMSSRKALSQQSLPSALQHQWFKPPFTVGHGKT
jgi:hypothetical protein